MSQVDKDIIERQCLNPTIQNCPQLQGFAVSKEERPDFILTSGNRIIGIEHFLVDTLMYKPQNQDLHTSVSRPFNNIMHNLLNKYQGDAIIGNEQKALSVIETQINQLLKAETEFDSFTFFEEFVRIVGDHTKRIPEYRKHNLTELGFLCEIDVINKDNTWCVLTNNQWVKQRINVPLTNDMWLLIKILLSLRFLDFFIITVIPIQCREKAKSLYLTIDSDPFTVDDFTYDKSVLPSKCKLELGGEGDG